MFLNGTALFFIVRTLFADAAREGFHYTVAGNDIYLAETLVSVLVLVAVGGLFVFAKPFLQRLHTALAIVLFLGVAATAAFCLPHAFSSGAWKDFGILGLDRGYAAFSLVILAPWAFVGFEVTAFDTAHFKFSTKKSGGMLVLAILAAGFAYIAMVLVSVAAVPDGFSSWQEYIAALDGLRGIASVPTFFAAKSIMGTAGLAVMTVTAVAAILTGITGAAIAALFVIVQLVPRLAAMEAMGSEAFLLLSLWWLLGFAFYWRTVVRSTLTEYSGMSTSGVALFALLVYSAIMWFAKLLAAEETAEAKKQKRMVELAGRRVLLAEDMQVNAEIMLMVLEMRGMKAEVAKNGRIAVEKFRAHEPGYFDAVLMDMRMPEMDGLEATRVIRAMDRPDAKKIPIIALTANAFDEDVQRSLQAGLNAHLSKPVQPEALFETLEGLITDGTGEA